MAVGKLFKEAANQPSNKPTSLAAKQSIIPSVNRTSNHQSLSRLYSARRLFKHRIDQSMSYPFSRRIIDRISRRIAVRFTQWVNESTCQLAIRRSSQLVNHSVYNSSFNYSVNQSVNELANQRTVRQSAYERMKEAAKQSMGHFMNERVGKVINQSISQLVEQSIGRAVN